MCVNTHIYIHIYIYMWYMCNMARSFTLFLHPTWDDVFSIDQYHREGLNRFDVGSHKPGQRKW